MEKVDLYWKQYQLNIDMYRSTRNWISHFIAVHKRGLDDYHYGWLGMVNVVLVICLAPT